MPRPILLYECDCRALLIKRVDGSTFALAEVSFVAHDACPRVVAEPVTEAEAPEPKRLGGSPT